MADHPRQLVVTLPTQPGDWAHVAGLAAIDDNTDILVIANNSEGLEPLMNYFLRATNGPTLNTTRCRKIVMDSSDKMIQLYSQLAPRDMNGKSQKPLELTKDNEQVNKIKTTLGQTSTIQQLLQYKSGEEIFTYSTLSPVTATSLIAERFKNEKDKAKLYQCIATRLASTLPTSEIKVKILAQKTPPEDLTKPVLLLWARYTGTNSHEGYNPAGDSDIEGQRQLLKLAEEANFSVITIGHDPAESRNEPVVHSDHHLGEFYNEELIQDKGRGGQLSFMLAMMERYPGNLYQMGQKTGAMDAAALAGLPTLYIEDKKSWAVKRMREWTENSVPFYKCAQIEDPPTLLGKCLRHLATIKGLRGTGPDEVPDRQWRMMALLLRLQKAVKGFEDTAELSPLEVKNTVIAADKNQMDEWDSQLWILSKANSEGYTPGDTGKIMEELESLRVEYGKASTIIRDGNGVYVKRKDLKKA